MRAPEIKEGGVGSALGGGVPQGFLEEISSWVLKAECDFTIHGKGILAVGNCTYKVVLSWACESLVYSENVEPRGLIN